MIKEFQGEYRWLSNFAPIDIRLGNLTFQSVEHAYMSMKSTSLEWKTTCASPSMTAGKIKRLSKTIILRPEWNDDFRLRIMEDLVRIKFKDPKYKSLLLATGNQNIQEGNYWNDKFFGICLKTCQGENHLGRIIMKIRDEIKGENHEKQ